MIPNVLAFAFVLVISLGSQATFSEAQTRIVGGEKSREHSWPWMAAIARTKSINLYQGQFCGGSLIHPNWVLLAAHCLAPEGPTHPLEAADIYVALGTNHLDQNFERAEVEKIYIHPQFDPDSLNNDIALIRLTSQHFLTHSLNIDLLPNSPYPHVGNKMSTAIGWGDTSPLNYINIYPTELRDVNLPIIPFHECQRIFGDEVTSNMFCAGVLAGGKDSCTGDSGGPLVIEDNGVFKQIGITSWGFGCAQKNSYGVYTKLSNYKGWIYNTMLGDKTVYLVTEISGTHVELSWNSREEAVGYKLYYTQSLKNGKISEIDFGERESISFNLSSGDKYYVAIAPYGADYKNLTFSNIQLIKIP
ncbi:serine protease [Bdellovibrionales bacterium]|nr:serine protease [Bdellovibrionales bacterium]